MGKNKKSKKQTQKPQASAESPKESRISMRDIEAMSDGSDDQAPLPPEEEWNEEAKNLRDAIMSGKFDHVLEREDGDASSVEEVELGEGDDDDDSGEHEDNDVGEEEADSEEDSGDEEEKTGKNVATSSAKRQPPKAASESSDEDESDVLSVDDENKEVASSKNKMKKSQSYDKNSLEEHDGEEETSEHSENEEEDEDDDNESDKELMQTLEQKNQVNSKALHIVTQELAAQKNGWSWAETFDIIPETPLPFDKKTDAENFVDIHDDLKREVAFYDNALEAVNEARLKCKEHKIPFCRPDDFYAEMVKTDEHMAKIKDRLIFETKKMEAVAMRKSNKEQKLRVKESQANRAAEKSKRKREHFKSLEDWQSSGAPGSRNDSALLNALEGTGPNKKRAAANKKYGFGGPRPRYKQNDRKDLNDTSSFNPRGNFPGGMKRTGKGKAGHRPGKRARDAKRSKS